MAEPWPHLGSFMTFHPLIIQIRPTPTAAAVRPAMRNCADGISKTDAIMRFMPSGNRAYIIPSMAIASARAVARSLIFSEPIQSLLALDRCWNRVKELEQFRIRAQNNRSPGLYRISKSFHGTVKIKKFGVLAIGIVQYSRPQPVPFTT